MSTFIGKNTHPPKGEDNSSCSDNSSDGDYELNEIRPQVGSTTSAVLRRRRKQCCSGKCMHEWMTIIFAFTLLYLVNGLYTWSLIEAMLSNTYNTLVTFGCIWVVFVICFFTLVIVVSNRKLKERLDHQRAVEEEEIRRREGIRQALDSNSS